jgi:hypothetical protein
MSKDASRFCKFLNQGLVYNNNTVNFTISPCCYYNKVSVLDIDQDIQTQIDTARHLWKQDDWNITCKICIDCEKSGQHSYRQASHDMIPQSSDRISVLTVAVNKQCNLACASCGSDSSSFWFQQNKRDGIQDLQKIVNLHKDDKHGMITKKFLSVFDKDLFDDITYIKFGGGEPLMSSTHEDILRKIANPATTNLQYTSNFSIEPSQKVYDLWSKFNLVKWCASLDGVDQQFEILRWPYKWHDLEKFVKKIKTQVPHNVMFGVEHTLNPLNVWYIDRFRDWFQKEFATNRFGDHNDFNIHVCEGNMSLNQTPPQLREMIRSKLGDHDPVMVILDQNPYIGSHHKLTSWLDSLDIRRKTNWRQVFREVSEFF